MFQLNHLQQKQTALLQRHWKMHGQNRTAKPSKTISAAPEPTKHSYAASRTSVTESTTGEDASERWNSRQSGMVCSSWRLEMEGADRTRHAIIRDAIASLA